ncbi:MAG: polyhydroxyalkanoic acid system family protein [Xanthomonadaceae bacterium]|jgi:putative polyhydroxyalkanoate system protein|nr:polyhydroxyalkanoic acid system family protein [Xanthomonadaceae bacterium]
MANIDILHVYTQSTDDARKAIDEMAVKLRDKFGLDTQWQEDTLQFSGSGIDGRIQMQPEQVRVTVELGFPISMMKDMVESEIRRSLSEKLS